MPPQCAPVNVTLPNVAATEALGRHLASSRAPATASCWTVRSGPANPPSPGPSCAQAADNPTMEVPSPSFTLVQIYDTQIGTVFHYDLWRLDGSDCLAELDWEDALDAIVLVEWPDRLGPLVRTTL